VPQIMPSEVPDLGDLECRVEPVLDVFDGLASLSTRRVREHVRTIRQDVHESWNSPCTPLIRLVIRLIVRERPRRAGRSDSPAGVQATAQGARSVRELADGMDVSRPAVSQHLKVLQAAGLIVPRTDGTRRFHVIDTSGLEALRRCSTDSGMTPSRSRRQPNEKQPNERQR
jgi:DNA-binding transcriptional ArsR family regulator